MWAKIPLFALGATVAVAENADARLNPIRKVVNLLQDMEKKVTAEGVKEKELYEKFMCYCKTGGSELDTSISAADDKIPRVGADITSSEERMTQTKADLKEAQTDRASAKDAVAEATALREKEAAAFASLKSDLDTNIAAITKAVAALEKGVAGGFLQTEAAQVLRHMAQTKVNVLEGERQELLAFLSGSHGNAYAPQSGEIIGILKEIKDEMLGSLKDAVAQEDQAIKTYKELMEAKAKEIGALGASIEAKTQQIGELGVRIVQLKEDLADTETARTQDEEYRANLGKSCATKTSEFEERSKTRSEELVTLAETIKVLNDDDATELFKKTLPSASVSLMQVLSSKRNTRDRALVAIRQSLHYAGDGEDRAGINFLALALSGKKALSKGGFDKVISMIDNMIAILKKEQQDDNDKKEYCSMQFDHTDDKKKALEQAIESTEQGIDVSSSAIATLQEEIKALEQGIKDLDKSVSDSTAQRQAENADFKDLMASDRAAKELLLFAKNRLNKFYNPKLYKAPAKRELDAQTRVAVDMGAEDAPTVAPSGIAGTGITVFAQVSAHTRVAPGPAPEIFAGQYKSKSSEGTGVIQMLDLLVQDLDKEMTEAETDEKNAQADYEAMMQESAAKRAQDSKQLSGKVGSLASTEGVLQSLKEQKGDADAELMALNKYISSVHGECDWLMQYFDARKEARAGEVDSLTKAKGVLNGADYSMLELVSRGHLRGRSQ